MELSTCLTDQGKTLVKNRVRVFSPVKRWGLSLQNTLTHTY